MCACSPGKLSPVLLAAGTRFALFFERELMKERKENALIVCSFVFGERTERSPGFLA